MKDHNKQKSLKRIRRKNRVRSKIFGTQERPRFSVFRSNKYIFLQLIDDQAGKTLVSAKDSDVKDINKIKGKVKRAYKVAKVLAERAKQKKIESVVFDRNGYKYHGRIKAVADGARDGGLKF